MKFTWAKKPETEHEFELLMQGIDRKLEEKGIAPWQRPLHIGFLLWEAFEWGGLVFPPKELSKEKGFEGDVLMAKAQKWYEDVYEENLNSDWALGFSPIKIGNKIWRARIGQFYGAVTFFVDKNLNNKGFKLSTSRDKAPASCNILCDIEGFTQGLADRLNEGEFQSILNMYLFFLECMMWRDSLPKTDFFKISHADYEESTSSLLAQNYGQSIWASQQSAEKLIKGILHKADKQFPKGRDGHDLNKLSEKLDNELGIKLNKTLIDIVDCGTGIRYESKDLTEARAIQANHAVLGIMKNIMESPISKSILEN